MRLHVNQLETGQWVTEAPDQGTVAGAGISELEALGQFLINNGDQLFDLEIEINPFRDPTQHELPVHAG